MAASNKNFATDCGSKAFAPISLSAPWVIARGAGELTTADNATITNPSSQIDTPGVFNLVRDRDLGTIVLVRMRYRGSPSQQLIVAVFGRTSSSNGWQRLYNRAATPAGQVALTAAPSTDMTDGTDKFTEVTLSHQFDCLGCKEIRIGIEQALTTSSAPDASLAVVEAKVI